MKVLVTGGTGYVGSHIAVALMAAGHDVRLLVRRPEQVATTFAPHGRSPGEVVVGDVLDESSVRDAVDGCDAVVHAAAVYSIDPRRAGEVLATNEAATRLVLGAAVAAGCDPVVHISSTVALTRRDGSGPDLPLGDLDLPYCRSKVASERIARDLQEQGHPVVSVYPGGVLGPHDPYLGDQAERLAWIVRGRFPAWPAGRMLYVDVRDVASVVAACLAAGPPTDGRPRRYVVPGHHAAGPELYAEVATAIGRRRPVVVVPAGVLRPQARLADAVQRRLPRRWHLPADREGTEIVLADNHFDARRTEQELGVHARPFGETVRDTITWLAEAGHVPVRYRPR